MRRYTVEGVPALDGGQSFTLRELVLNLRHHAALDDDKIVDKVAGLWHLEPTMRLRTLHGVVCITRLPED